MTDRSADMRHILLQIRNVSDGRSIIEDTDQQSLAKTGHQPYVPVPGKDREMAVPKVAPQDQSQNEPHSGVIEVTYEMMTPAQKQIVDACNGPATVIPDYLFEQEKTAPGTLLAWMTRQLGHDN